MTIVILLVLVVVLWILVLAPSAWRRVTAARQGVGSIDHFHHQLELLEHAGPKLVAPAYRLHTALPGGVIMQAPPADVNSNRPKLVLLRPTEDEYLSDVDDLDGAHYERVCVLDAPEPEVDPALHRMELAHHRREEARRRCTLLLRLLTATAVSTAIIGAMHSFRLVWIVTVLSGVAALGLLGLMGYARELEVKRDRRMAEQPRYEGSLDGYYGEDYYQEAYYEEPYATAQSGFPGAWDDEYEIVLRQAAVGN